MAYQIALSTRLARSLSEVAREQLERALADLEPGDPATLDERVHDARKCLKKTRALLRLVRPSLPEASYRRENSRLRDAARALASARDRAAILECTGRMKHDRPSLQQPLEDFERTFQTLQPAIEQHARELELPRELLRAALRRVPRLIRAYVTPSALRRGLAACHRRGRRRLRAAQNTPSVELFHEWRKSVKDTWYHLRLFGRTWPALLSTQIQELERLSELLGDEHDLNVLRPCVQSLSNQLGPSDIETLLAAIDQRIERDRERACALGVRVYAERGNAFARRLCTYLGAPPLDEVDR